MPAAPPLSALATSPGRSPRDPASGSDANRLVAWVGALVATFAALLVWRVSILQSPPYWDQITLWHEADYLVRTDFDYPALFAEEKVPQGGWPAYLVSISPTLLALLMVVSPSPQVTLIVFHLFCLLCTAAIAVTVFAILRERVGMVSAALVSGAMVTLPLFSAQVDMVGLEIPLTLPAVLVVLYVVQGRFYAATAAAAVAFTIKNTGALLSMALIAYLGLWLLVHARPGDARTWKPALLPLLLNVALVAAEYGLMFAAQIVTAMSLANVDPHSKLSMIRLWSPDLMVLMGLAAVFAMSLLITAFRRRLVQAFSARKLSPVRTALANVIDTYPEVIFSGILMLGLLTALLRAFYTPRYLVIAVPFVFLILGRATLSRPLFRPVFGIGFGLLIGFNLANARGHFFVSIADAMADRIEYGRIGSFWERSREYLEDHESNIKLAQLLSEDFRDTPIIAGMPFNYFYRLPRFGYVEEPLQLIDVDAPHRFAYRYPGLSELLARKPTEAVLITTTGENPEEFAVPPDVLVYRDNIYPSLVALQITLTDRSADPVEHYLSLFLKDRHSMEPDSVLRRATILAEAGYTDRAIDELESGVAQSPQEPELRRALVRWLLVSQRYQAVQQHALQLVGREPSDMQAHAYAGLARRLAAPSNRLGELSDGIIEAIAVVDEHDQYDRLDELIVRLGQRPGSDSAQVRGLLDLLIGRGAPALAALQQATESEDGDADAHYYYAVTLLNVGEVDRAQRELEALLSADDSLAMPYLLRGVIQWNCGQHETALDSLRQYVARSPMLAEAHSQLGSRLLELGRLDDARQSLAAAIRLRPEYAEAHNLLGVCYVRLRQPAQAVEAFRAAVDMAPDHISAAAHLASAEAMVLPPAR